MCKTPADSKAPRMINPEPDDDEEYEDLPPESGSSFMDTSSEDEDEEGSDSDAESATGHRVTTDMAVWYMLKQEGFLTDEKYASKTDMYVDNIETVLPKIPESEFSDEEDSDISGSIDFKFLDLFVDLKGAHPKAGEVVNEKNNGLTETTNGDEVRNADSIEDAEKAAKVAKLDLSENNTNDKREEQVNKETKDVTMSECALEETVNSETSHKQGENTNQEEISNILNVTADVEENDVVVANTEEKSNQDFKSMEVVDNKGEYENAHNESNNLHQPNKETKSFKYILKELKKDNRISKDCDYYDVLKTYVKCLDKHYKNNEAVELFGTPTDDLRDFARCLHFYSPSCYKYIIETYNTPLPGHKVLSSWYMREDRWGMDQSGLMERAFDVLKKRAASKRLTCALMSRDIYLRNYGRDCDYVDFAGGYNDEYCEKAVIIFAFVLVSLDEDWKMPIGYVYARDMPAESQAGLINVCLTQCYEAGVDVVAVTLETPTPAEFLGCSFEDPKNLKTTFKHPECDREVAVWIDPCLALRSIRDLLNVKDTLEDGAGNTVCWSLIRKLKHLYSEGKVDYSKPGCLELRNHIAKVSLTTEIFSESLARALELCEEVKPLVFNDSAPTQKYIKIINMLYDILHSTKVKNWSDVDQQLNEASEYMIGIYCNEANKLVVDDKQNLAADKKFIYHYFVEGKQACGFVTLLTCITSLKHLYTTLVEKEQRIDSLNTHRLCKDHVEDFVKNVRAYKLIDTSKFNGWIYQNFCERWFDYLEDNPRYFDQNMTLEQWPFKNKYTPAATLNKTCGKRSYDEVYNCHHVVKKLSKTSHEEAIKVLGHFTKAMDSEMKVADRKYMVGYLAGWIAAKFAKCLKCEVCVDALCSHKKLWFHKFITSKAHSVCLPSEEMFQICWECERALRQKVSVPKLQVWVLRCLTKKFPWLSHEAKHHRTHFIHLVRAVIAKYIPLRVAAPFSTKENKRILSMFRMFSSISRLGMFEQPSGQNGVEVQ